MVVFAVVPIEVAMNIIDIGFAMMAIPTLVSSIWLAPKVIARAKTYFASLDSIQT